MNSELPHPEEPPAAQPHEPASFGEAGAQPGEMPPSGTPIEPAAEAPPPSPPLQPSPVSPPPEISAPPNHRFATPSLILGVLSMLGILSCLCPLFWLPFLQLCPSLWTLALGGGALFTGNAARQEIEASGGNIGGRDQADAGFIMGIIGVAFGLLAICLGVLWAVLWIVLPEGPFRAR